MNKIIVPDACVFTKLFYDEPDSSKARAFFEYCVRVDTRLVVPDLFKYEIAQTSRYVDHALNDTLDLFDAHTRAIMTISSPERETWLLAEDITKKGNEKSGFPSMYDSIYHALAISLDGTFLTADKKHYAKAKDYGHITLLNDWESLFTGTQENN